MVARQSAFLSLVTEEPEKFKELNDRIKNFNSDDVDIHLNLYERLRNGVVNDMLNKLHE